MRTKSIALVGGLIMLCSVQAQQFSGTFNYNTSIIKLNSMVIDEDGYRYEGNPIEGHIMLNDRNHFIYTMMNNAGDASKPTYLPGTFTNINKDQVFDLYSWRDTVMIEDPYTLEMKDTAIIGLNDLFHDVESIDFNETWSYSKSGSLTKKVNYFEPVLTVYSRMSGEKMGTKPLIRQKGGWSGFKGSLITRLIKYRVMIKDTAASNPKEYMKTDERNTWVKMVRELALNGKLKVYDPFLEDVQLKKEEISNILVTRDSIKAYRSYEPYAEYDTVMVSSQWDQISCIDFYESWSFDKSGNLVKEVLGYKMLAAIYGPYDNELRGFLPVFMIYNSEKSRQKLADMNFFWKSLW